LEIDEGDLVLCRLEGDITVPDTEARDAFATLLGSACYGRTVLLSLAKTSFVDSSGIGWLIVNHRHFRDSGGQLILYDVPASVGQALEFVRLHSYLTIVADAAAARQRASVRGP
jgi:anti-anti-sigma factor